MRRLPMISALACLFLPAAVLAADAATPVIDRIGISLIDEDNGALFAADGADVNRIAIRNDIRRSVQLRIDVVMTGDVGRLYEQYHETPVLHVVIHGAGVEPGAAAMVDAAFRVSYVGPGGETVRSLILDHACNGFDLVAGMAYQGQRTAEVKRSVALSCGD